MLRILTLIVLYAPSICLFTYAFIFYVNAKVDYSAEQTRATLLADKISFLETQILELKEERKELDSEINKINNDKEELQEKYSKNLETFKQNLQYASEQYADTLELTFIQAEKDFDKKQNLLEKEKQQIIEDINTLKESLNAGVKARLREEEKKKKLDFYKIELTNSEILDIKRIQDFALSLNNPLILNKLIWTTYYQKRISALCNKVLGVNKKMGIYKITNLETGQSYIGQSVNVADRWKMHCKLSCETGAAATNKLYKNMYDYGLWSFSFELLEECERAQLNEKEAFWISMYQTDLYGLNSTKGNK